MKIDFGSEFMNAKEGYKKLQRSPPRHNAPHNEVATVFAGEKTNTQRVCEVYKVVGMRFKPWPGTYRYRRLTSNEYGGGALLRQV